jgi:hypothetical protein
MLTETIFRGPRFPFILAPCPVKSIPKERIGETTHTVDPYERFELAE